MVLPREGFTVIELLVVIGIVSLLLAILLPALEHARHNAYITKCASNLHQIGTSLAVYQNENHGQSPRTTYDPAAPLTVGTGVAAPDPFGPGGPVANDVSASVFLLVRSEKLPTSLMICPYNDDTSYHPDSAAPGKQSNFTDFRHNLAYSFANPYPSKAVADAGYRPDGKGLSTFAVAADLNPGVRLPRNDAFDSDPGDAEKANSNNHEREGQNVLFGDGHVAFVQTPLCGVGKDNIYTAKTATSPDCESSPADATDSVLLPDGDD